MKDYIINLICQFFVLRSWKYWEGKKDTIKNAPDAIDFQTEHVADLVR